MRNTYSLARVQRATRSLAVLGLLLATAGTAQAQVTSFAYTGGTQTYTVPAGVTAIQVLATGASGGRYLSTSTNYSYGARVQATLSVTPGEVLTVVVGGQGNNAGSGGLSGIGSGVGGSGGFNGGGAGAGMYCGGGGGATDLRRASTTSTGDYLTSRNALLVAAGSGGSDDNSTNGGNGGTPAGSAGTSTSTYVAPGATQAGPGVGAGAGSSGVAGTGGNGYYDGAGGGGGYYGGAGFYYSGSNGFGGGGGGSSWATALGSSNVSYSTAPTAPANGQLTITPVAPLNLTVSTTMAIPAGSYNNITVTGTGNGTLAGNVVVIGALTVQAGGIFNDGCAIVSGAGSFTLAAGGTLGICAAQGISSSGPTGAIQVTGTRSFSTEASYTYNGTAAQVTGTGLPATVRILTLTNASGLTLTGGTTATTAATLSTGVLSTGANALTLSPSATLAETATGYATGTLQTTRSLDAAGTSETFGGLGLTLTPSGSTLPGSTLVRRVTGTPLSAAGGNQGIRRYFDIQPTVKTGLSVALVLTARDDERNGIPAANLRLYKSDTNGSTWQAQAATYSSIPASGNQPLTYTASLGSISSFSLWTLGNSAAPLPVRAATATDQPVLAVYPTEAAAGQAPTYAYTGPTLAPGTLLEVYDATGRRVATQALAGPAGPLQVAALASGWYWVRLPASGAAARFYQP